MVWPKVLPRMKGLAMCISTRFMLGKVQIEQTNKMTPSHPCFTLYSCSYMTKEYVATKHGCPSW